MLNKYPLWKNLVIVFALVIGFIYALPNFFPDDYAIQITGARGRTEVEQRVLDRALAKLEQEGIEVKSSLLEERDALIRLTSSDDQPRARPAVQAALGNEYLVALNMAPSTCQIGMSRKSNARLSSNVALSTKMTCFDIPAMTSALYK